MFVFSESIEYLGREINGQGVRPSQRKVEALLRMEKPRSVKQLWQFLGLASYFRKFIGNFATIVELLTRLTRKNTPWEWRDAQERAFVTIKDKLTTRPVLAIRNSEHIKRRINGKDHGTMIEQQLHKFSILIEKTNEVLTFFKIMITW